MHSGLLRHDEIVGPGRSRGRQSADHRRAARSDPRARCLAARLRESLDLRSAAARQGLELLEAIHALLFDPAPPRRGCRHPPRRQRLDGYDVIVAPAIQIVDQRRADASGRAPHAMRSLVVGPRTGFRLPNGQVHPDGQPGPLRDLLGCTLLNFDALRPQMTVTVDDEEVAALGGVLRTDGRRGHVPIRQSGRSRARPPSCARVAPSRSARSARSSSVACLPMC